MARIEKSIFEDFERFKVLIEKLKSHSRYQATVKSTIEPGILLVDVNGLIDARCYVTYNAPPASGYVPNAVIMVAIDESGICFEIPPEFPRIGQKTMVVQAIDDSVPPTLGLDWIRFSNAILNPFDTET